MKLANIVLKLDKIGTSVPKKYVSPAEVMFLVSDHHTNAGGDPIVKLDILDDDAEVKPLEVATKELEELQASQDKLDNVMNITDEVRQKREEKIRRKMQVKLDAITRLKAIQAMRTFTPALERRRLISIYGQPRINKYYPGQIPQLPSDFAEARSVGVGTEAPSERLLTVGAEGQQS